MKQMKPARTPETTANNCLLGRVMKCSYSPVRREQAGKVPEEQEQDAEVEQVAAPAQAAGAQHLRRVAPSMCTGRGRNAPDCPSDTDRQM